MEIILRYVFGFIIAMTLILWLIPDKKIKVIGGFFVVVLPKIPFVGMIKAYFDAKNKKSNLEITPPNSCNTCHHQSAWQLR